MLYAFEVKAKMVSCVITHVINHEAWLKSTVHNRKANFVSDKRKPLEELSCSGKVLDKKVKLDYDTLIRLPRQIGNVGCSIEHEKISDPTRCCL